MLIKVSRETDAEARRIRNQGQVPLYLPEWTVYKEKLKRLEGMNRSGQLLEGLIRQEKQKQLPGYQEEVDRQLKDTKPEMYKDNSDPNRPVIVVGAGTAWREDLKDLARRTKEKPGPKKDPKWRKKFDVINDIDRNDQFRKDFRTKKTVFHVPNNPLTKEG